MEANGDELSDAPIQKLNIQEAFEPSVLVEKLATTEDEKIRLIDIPERLQLRDINRSVEGSELQQEALWINNLLKRDRGFLYVDEHETSYVKCLVHLLGFLREDFFEIPFIQTHRKEYFEDFFSASFLWRIYDLDEKWKSFIQQKHKLIEYVLKIIESRPDSFDEEYLNDLVNRASSDEDLNDIYDFLQFYHQKEMAELDGGRKGMKKSKWELFQVSGLLEYSKKIGITPQQLGTNLLENYKKFSPVDPQVSPLILAESFISPAYHTVEEIIKESIILTAYQLFVDPVVRVSLRSLLESFTIITCLPTDKGIREISPLHEFYSIKYVTNKPFKSFKADEFLLYLKAEKSGHITLDIGLAPIDDIFRDVSSLYFSDSYSELAESWNDVRHQVFAYLIEDLVKPLLVKETKQKLTDDALYYASEQVSHNLGQRLCIGLPNFHSIELQSQKIMAISWGEGGYNSVTWAVILSYDSKVVDYIKLLYLQEKLDSPRRNEDIKTLENFMKKHEPKAVAVAGTTVETRFLYSLVDSVIKDLPKGEFEIKLSYVEDDIARIYQNSAKAMEEFPKFPSLLKYCISLGRSMQEPLFEHAGLFNEKKDILGLSTYVHQHMIPDDLVLKAMERAFVDTISLICVDVNYSYLHPNGKYVLQFVPGFGPRKAGFFLKQMEKRGSLIEKRSSLVKLIGPKVFVNCASFLLIDPKFFSDKDVQVDILDTTRIHPENYEMARKMAADALDIEDDEDSEENPSIHVEEVVHEPKKLDDLLLEDYAKQLEDRQGILKYKTLIDIRYELQNMNYFKRGEFVGVPNELVFAMLTGEDLETFKTGLVVPCRVTKVTEKLVFCRLECGVVGIIPFHSLDDYDVADCREVVVPNQVITSKIMSINLEKFSVDLSCRPSDLANIDFDRTKCDEYFDENRENIDLQKLKGIGKITVR